MIYALHGVVENVNYALFIHRILTDSKRFTEHLKSRPKPYVPLASAIRGEGDALTLDDSTAGAADAARLAREHGHHVTVFLSGYHIEYQIPYWFSRLNQALDDTALDRVPYDGSTWSLQTPLEKARFRQAVKRNVYRLAEENDRQDLISYVYGLLGVAERAPVWAASLMTVSDVRQLLAIGVEVQNHGWAHLPAGAASAAAHRDDIHRGRKWLREAFQVDAEFYAVPNGDGLPSWETSPDYSAWFLLDASHPPGEVRPGVFNRAPLSI